MFNNRYVFRILSLIVGSCITACTTAGPVKTQIDPQKNRITSQPTGFQSPKKAYSLFSEKQPSTKTNYAG